MNPYNLAMLFFAYCSFLICFLVLFKRNDSIGRSFAVFSFFVTAFGFNFSIYTSSSISYSASLFLGRLANICAIFIAPSWLMFVGLFLGIFPSIRRITIGSYVLSALIAIFGFSPLFVTGLGPATDFDRFVRPGPLYYVFTVEFFVLVIYGFFLILKNLNSQQSNQRAQTLAMLIGTCIGFIGGSFTFFGVYEIRLHPYGIFLMPFYPFVMAYAITRQGFLDPEEVLAIHREKLALIGLVSSSINHEIKNPLFMVREMVKKLGDSEDARKIANQIDRMQTIVERLGNFARPEHGETALEELDLRSVVDNALFFANAELKYQNIKTKIQISDNLPRIKMDRSQLEVILLNLIINAYHAMQNGGELRIEGRSEGKQIEVTIADSGTGIPKDELKNIFKPFYTTKKDKGTGLGLHIVKTLVEQNNGKISVDSEPGKGTKFSLSFKANPR